MTCVCKRKRRSQSVAWRVCESAKEDPSPCAFKFSWKLLPHPTPPIPTLTAQYTFHACATWHERYCPTPPHPSTPHITDMHIVLRVSRDVHGFSRKICQIYTGCQFAQNGSLSAVKSLLSGWCLRRASRAHKKGVLMQRLPWKWLNPAGCTSPEKMFSNMLLQWLRGSAAVPHHVFSLIFGVSLWDEELQVRWPFVHSFDHLIGLFLLARRLYISLINKIHICTNLPKGSAWGYYNTIL